MSRKEYQTNNKQSNFHYRTNKFRPISRKRSGIWINFQPIDIVDLKSSLHLPSSNLVTAIKGKKLSSEQNDTECGITFSIAFSRRRHIP